MREIQTDRQTDKKTDRQRNRERVGKNERERVLQVDMYVINNQRPLCPTVFRELAALLDSLDLSADMTLPLSFDLLLRRAQDKFGVNPFLTIQTVQQFYGTAYEYTTRVRYKHLITKVLPQR